MPPSNAGLPVTRTMRLRQSDGGPVVTCRFRSCCLLFVPTPPWRLTASAWPPRLDSSVRHLGASVPRRAAKGDPAINRCRQVRDPTARRGMRAFAGWCPGAARCCSFAVKTAVTFWQPALRDDRSRSPLDPQLAAQPREVFCAGQQWLLGPVSPGSGGGGAVISTLAQLASPTVTSVDEMVRRRSRWCGHGGS
jgi:hypothetical protein